MMGEALSCELCPNLHLDQLLHRHLLYKKSSIMDVCMYVCIYIVESLLCMQVKDHNFKIKVKYPGEGLISEWLEEVPS